MKIQQKARKIFKCKNFIHTSAPIPPITPAREEAFVCPTSPTDRHSRNLYALILGFLFSWIFDYFRFKLAF